MAVEIRVGLPEDAEIVSEVVSEVVRAIPYYNDEIKEITIDGFAPEFVEWRLETLSDYCLVAEEGGKALGVLYGYFQHGTFFMSWLTILPSARGKGVAQKLVQSLEEHVRARGASKVWMHCLTHNTEISTLNTKLGYSIAGVLKEYSFGHDFYIWEKVL